MSAETKKTPGRRPLDPKNGAMSDAARAERYREKKQEKLAIAVANIIFGPHLRNIPDAILSDIATIVSDSSDPLVQYAAIDVQREFNRRKSEDNIFVLSQTTAINDDERKEHQKRWRKNAAEYVEFCRESDLYSHLT